MSAAPQQRPSPVKPLRRTAVDSVIMPQMGMQLPRQMPFEKWVSVGNQLAQAASSSAWCLGDWLVYGETCFTGRYRSAIERTSLEYKTLRNYAWVARKFPLPRRRSSLSFGHHAEVAGLLEPEQDFWLRKAESHGWSRNDMRREIQDSLRERSRSAFAPGEAEGPDSGDLAQLQVTVTAHQLEVIRKAACKAQLAVAEWVQLALEQAARAALESESNVQRSSAHRLTSARRGLERCSARGRGMDAHHERMTAAELAGESVVRSGQAQRQQQGAMLIESIARRCSHRCWKPPVVNLREQRFRDGDVGHYPVELLAGHVGEDEPDEHASPGCALGIHEIQACVHHAKGPVTIEGFIDACVDILVRNYAAPRSGPFLRDLGSMQYGTVFGPGIAHGR